MNLHPETLKQTGFQGCEHPLTECVAFPSYHTTKFCLTCGAALVTGGWKPHSFGMTYNVQYHTLEQYGLMSSFEFWIAQRPESRVFGDI